MEETIYPGLIVGFECHGNIKNAVLMIFEKRGDSCVLVNTMEGANAAALYSMLRNCGDVHNAD